MHAARLGRFHREILARYLNCHCPCLFTHVETDAVGKRRRTYLSADIRTSYDALKALPEAGSYRDDVRRVGSGGVRTDRPSDGAGTAKGPPDALRETACGGALKAAATGSPFRVVSPPRERG